MKKFLLPALAATLLLAATAVAAPLDAFKGMKGTLDIAGGTAITCNNPPTFSKS